MWTDKNWSWISFTWGLRSRNNGRRSIHIRAAVIWTNITSYPHTAHLPAGLTTVPLIWTNIPLLSLSLTTLLSRPMESDRRQLSPPSLPVGPSSSTTSHFTLLIWTRLYFHICQRLNCSGLVGLSPGLIGAAMPAFMAGRGACRRGRLSRPSWQRPPALAPRALGEWQADWRGHRSGKAQLTLAGLQHMSESRLEQREGLSDSELHMEVSHSGTTRSNDQYETRTKASGFLNNNSRIKA